MIKQSQQQRLLQRLSPQQIQVMKLLQVPTAQLEERIKEELEENPALEYGTEDDTDEFGLPSNNDDSGDADYIADEEGEIELSGDGADKVDLDDYLRNEDDYGSGGSGYDYKSDDDHPTANPGRLGNP